MTALTFELTVLDDDSRGTAGFAPAGEVHLVEAEGDHSTVRDTFHDYTINLTKPAPTGGLLLSLTSPRRGYLLRSRGCGSHL